MSLSDRPKAAHPPKTPIAEGRKRLAAKKFREEPDVGAGSRAELWVRSDGISGIVQRADEANYWTDTLEETLNRAPK